jgi:DUF1680 family protein
VAGFGIYPALHLNGTTDASQLQTELYFPAAARRAAEITAIPYCLWGQREPGEMLVWMRRI